MNSTRTPRDDEKPEGGSTAAGRAADRNDAGDPGAAATDAYRDAKHHGAASETAGDPDVDASNVAVMSSAEAEEKAQEVLREHDTASRHRVDSELGPWRWLIFILALGLTGFQLYTAFAGSRPTLVQGAIHVGGAMGLIFLLYPLHRSLSLREDTKPGLYWGSLVLDTILAFLAMGCSAYMVLNYDYLTGVQVQIFGYSDFDTTVALVGILLILEGTRRCVGLPIVIIATLALLYFWLGKYSPILPYHGTTWQNMVQQTWYSSRSIFGIPIQVSSTFVFLFLLFGVVLVRTNIGAYFNGLAFRLTGKFAGGPAKAAVVASAMQGTVTGSSVANAVASGSFTIPMMKKVGFKAKFAAATEATASTGGQIMPPIMGAAVFIMAEYTGIAYSTIILVAVIPAFMYFAGVMLAVHFEAKRNRIHGMRKDQLPSWKYLLTRIDQLLPLAVIIYMLMTGTTPAKAALWGIGTALVLSFLRESTRLSIRGVFEVLESGARVALPVIAACATAGMVAGIVTATGLGGRLADGILTAAGENFFLVMFFTMVACLVLGMGLPTTANYVVTATVAAPILVSNFDVPILAAHLFVFYFGLLADITPPVCLAAYAASGIAGSNPLKSGVTAFRVAIAGFIVPYVFVSAPGLIFQTDDTVMHFLQVFITALLGMTAISAATAGYFFDHLHWWERIVLIAAGIAMVIPALWVSLIGIAVAVLMALLQRMRAKRRDGSTPPAERPAAVGAEA